MITRTTTSLLEGLVDPANAEVWSAFDERFRPILFGFGRRLGLADEDAADAAQEALMRFVRSYRDGRYDRERGRLSSWLLGIARNCIADVASRNRARRERRGLSAVDDRVDDTVDRAWDEECEREVLRRALTRLREETRTEPRTIEAFELLALGGRRPAEVASMLDMSANDVYLAKHRCLGPMREFVEEIRAAYELD